MLLLFALLAKSVVELNSSANDETMATAENGCRYSHRGAWSSLTAISNLSNGSENPTKLLVYSYTHLKNGTLLAFN